MSVIQNPYEIIYNRIDRLEKILLAYSQDLDLVKNYITALNTEKYIKPKDVKEKFGISLPTQISYDKKGILKPYYLGDSGRNKYYKLSEVEESLKSK